MMHRRSFSVGNAQKQRRRPLSNNPVITQKNKADYNEMMKNSRDRDRLKGINIFKNHKEEAIKSIINQYFQQQIQQDQIMMQNHHKVMRRTQRIRKISDTKKNNQNKDGQESAFSSSVHVQPALSKTYHVGWGQKRGHQLPPIHEFAQYPEEETQNIRHSSFAGSNAQSIMLRSSSAFSQMCNPQIPQVQQKHLFAYQNQLFKISVVFKDGKPFSRMKQFKQMGIPVLERQMKMKSYNLPKIWKQSNRSPLVYQMKIQSPLKDQLCRIKCDPANPQNLRVQPKPFFKRISANNFQELKALLRLFCEDLQKIQGKVINNKVTPQNIFITQDYKMCLAQWGYASFRDSFNIQKNIFQTRVDPILRGEKGWFLPPQYLAPQIINQMLGGTPQDIWNCSSSPDIWSLGLTLFEVMTLIPIWCYSRCLVMTKIDEFPTIKHVQKTGLLGVPGRDLKKLQEKQLIAQKIVEKQIEYWPQPSKNLGKIIIQMLQPRIQSRITLKGILSQL